MLSTAPPRERAVLVAAARHGLPGSDHRLDLDGVDTERLVATARFDGITGFLATAMLDGALDAEPELAAEVMSSWRQALVATVRVEALGVRVAGLLDGADVRWRLTKGPALAHLDYAEAVSTRTFGDVDLVVHPADWVLALRALGEAGYRRPAPELRPGFDVRFGKGATLVDDAEMEVDLHLRFAIGRFGVRARTEELFDRGDHIQLAGRSIPTLEGADRLLHACHHLALGGFSGLRVARDVAQLLLVSRVDWERTVATAERWDVGAVVARGIELAWERLALEVAHPAVDWARRSRVGRGDRRALEVFERERPFREQALTAVPALPLRQVPPYLLALAVPEERSRRSGERSAVGHVRSRLPRLLRRSRRRS